MKPACVLTGFCLRFFERDAGSFRSSGVAHVQDTATFRSLVERLNRQIFQVAYALVGNAAEADRIAQNVFVRVYYRAQLAAPQEDVVQYAFRLAIEESFAALRRRRLWNLLSWLRGSATVSDRFHPKESSPSRAAKLALGYLAMIPMRERALLVLREVAALPIDAIAVIVDIEACTVRKGLLSARLRLLRASVPKEDKSAAQLDS